MASKKPSPNPLAPRLKQYANQSITRRGVLSAAAAGTLAACAPAITQRKDADVIVIGAGLSGLFSAMWLAEQGYKVIVLEASNRIGGRLWTLDDVNGRPEAGGSQVGQTYARIRYAAEKLGVAINPSPPPPSRDRLIAIGDQRMLQSEWSTARANPFPDAFRAAPPDRALFAASARQNPFAWAGAWREATPDIDQSADAFLGTLGFDAPSRKLMNVALNANELDTYSMINVWRSLRLFAEDAALGPSGAIEGGSQRLPEAMAASLGDAVKPGFAVHSVEKNDAGVAVSSDQETLRSDYCILALPFPAIQNLNLTPELPPLQADAVQD
ncbi:MAG: FAD-dependent oxidoreductase, partial [Pseudomonadota bacterium]